MALLCNMEIESLYSQAKNTIIFPPICSNCGMNNEFVNRNVISEENDDRRVRPLCIKYHRGGKESIIFGRKQARKLKRRKHGSSYVYSKVSDHKQTKLTDNFSMKKPDLTPL